MAGATPGAAPCPAAVIYTPGKVGSTTVARSLRAAGVATHHIHILRRRALIDRARAALAEDRLPLRHICTAMAERRGILKNREAYWIVTLVRDPVARSLSGFFETLHLRRDGLTEGSPPADLAAAFLRGAGGVGLDWWEREMKGELGIDILTRRFDTDRRCADLEGDRLTVFRTDCPDAEKAAVLTRRFGREIRLEPANVGAQKSYAAAYQGVRGTLRLPEALARRIYGSDYVRHFWTPEERADMLARWCAPAPEGRP